MDKSSHCVYDIGWHIVFCPRYRRGAMAGQAGEYMSALFLNIAGHYGYVIRTMEVMPDHVHILLSAPPTVAGMDIVKTLKSISARYFFQKYPSLRESFRNGFWSKGKR
jgi:putative transposase